MQRDYFVLMRARSQSHPLLSWDQSAFAFYKRRPVEATDPVKLKLGAPVPPRPIMVDHHSLPEPVVSTRLKDVLEPLNLYGVQIVPADVRMPDETTLRYWLLHLWHAIPCMDRQRSVFKLYPDGDLVLSLNKLVLDEQVLKGMPLEKRLVFLLEEDSVSLFHGSVVERIMALQPPPEGLRFIPGDQWGDASAFRG